MSKIYIYTLAITFEQRKKDDNVDIWNLICTMNNEHHYQITMFIKMQNDTHHWQDCDRNADSYNVNMFDFGWFWLACICGEREVVVSSEVRLNYLDSNVSKPGHLE